MSSTKGMDASLVILRQELEGMQKQDKAIYTQLLTLQESIQGLKAELRKEREECEEAFRDLEENSRKDFDDEVFMKETETEQHSNETGEEKESSPEKIWKHDRQDSGISVKTPDVETHDTAPSNQTKFSTQDLGKFSTSYPVSKPAIILHDLNTHVKTTNVEITQKTSSFLRPPLIQHSKQDSGILIDEEAVKDTKLLSRLVESSEMFEKLETRKYDRIIQREYQKVRENTTMYCHHQRSRSSNDLLLKPQHHRTLPHQYSLGNLRPKHAHTNSCPQNMPQQFTSQGKEPHPVENPPRNKFTELDKLGKKLGRSQDANLNHPSQRSATTSEFNTLVLRSGSISPVPKAAFKSILPKHLHTRSLPSTSITGFMMAENELSGQGNRRSMQNIAEYKVVPAHQMRPRQRSASVVDLDKDSTREGSVAPHKTNVLPREMSDGLKQDKDNTKENSETAHKVTVVHVDGSEQARDKQNLNQAKDNLTSDRIPTPVTNKSEQSVTQVNNKPQSINHLKPTHKIKITQDKSSETGESVKTVKPLRAVLVSAREVNVANTAERSPLSRRCSLDERSTGSDRPGDAPQRRFTITNFETDRISQRQQFENGRFSPRFLTPHSLHHSRNHLRHHTMPEYDVTRRRHSLYTCHAPSRSWDGYSRKTNEGKGITRSASQVSLV